VPYYRRYLEHNPVNGEVWFDLADVHGRAGDWPAARAVMASRLELDPDDAAVLYNLGAIEAALGNVAAARGFFEKAAADTQAPAVARQAREALAALEKKP
jgi:tetratricopeptide (TPR) repeat protein